MSSTYTKIYIQVLFAVKGRSSSIQSNWETANHIHFLIGMKPSCGLSDLVREIKKSSNQFVNENHFCRQPFAWQEGFGAFSYGHSQPDRVIRYIQNQKEQPKRISFKEEYMEFLKKFKVEYQDKYLFDWEPQYI